MQGRAIEFAAMEADPIRAERSPKVFPFAHDWTTFRAADRSTTRDRELLGTGTSHENCTDNDPAE